MPEAAPVAPVVVEAPKLTPIQKAVAAYDKVRADAAARAETPKPMEPLPTEPKTPTDPKPAEPVPTEEPPKPAAPVEPAPAPPAEPLSAAFGRVARLEREAREKIKAAKTREESAAKRVEEMEAKLSTYETAKANAKLNPEAWNTLAGLTYEDQVQFQLNGKAPTTDAQVSSVKAEIDAFKRDQAAEREKQAREAQEQAQAQHRERYNAWAATVVDFVKADAVKYELTNQQDKQHLVVQVIQKQYEDTQKVLTEAEAADLVEKHLEEEAEKAFTAKKFKERFTQVQKQPAPVEPRVPTLSNGLTASTPIQNGAPRRKSWADRKEAALLAMERKT